MFGLRPSAAVTAFVLALTVSASLLFGSTAHAIVPHSHDGGEIAWQSLHASLSHAEKKSLIVASISTVMIVAAAFAVFFVPMFAPLPIAADTRLLHRGIHKSRKFR